MTKVSPYGTPIREWIGVDARRFEEQVLTAREPAVFRGIAATWPAVQASDLSGYLDRFDNGTPCPLLEAPPEARGRYFYDRRLTGFNFKRSPCTVAQVLGRLSALSDAADPPALALQAVAADATLPGFSAANPAPFGLKAVIPRLWIGNRVHVATHHDLFRNLAVVVAGRRRFTLFPPDQISNLYLGPLEFTPAGTPISMVDAATPDLDRFPMFATAMAAARTTELSPGDAIYIPYLWWHHVESLDSLSVLANYWWSEAPQPQPGLAPFDVLGHARLAFSALSPEQRAAWRPVMDHFVFDDTRSMDHVPADRRGILGSIGDAARRALRHQLGALLRRD